MPASKPDYYDILGVNKTASAEELKKAYRKQALEWHPDKHMDNKEAAEKRFKEINEAYQILSDPAKRQNYDQFGHAAFSPGGSPGSGNPFSRGGPFQYTYSQGNPNVQFDFGDPFDIFEQFFGGGGGNPFARNQRTIPRYGISISFMEAVNGVEKEVEIEGKRRKIKIPPGVDDGSRIQFGDFILSTNVKPHPVFERDGADIYVAIPVAFSTLVLGGEISVPTVDEEVTVKIRPGTQAGSMLRLRSHGITHLNGRGKGDQYVKITVAIPTKLSRSQKEAIKNLQEVKL
jgi:curved DNA-binding protein